MPSRLQSPRLPYPDRVLILGIETATNVCSVALVQGEKLLGELSVDVPRSHASQLVPLVQRVLKDHGKKPADLDAVAVSAGPGSYTGLRIGASTAKGLAFATGAALVAVPTLEALALAVQPRAEHPILTVLPSRRDEVYAAVYIVESNGLGAFREPEAIELTEIDVWLPESELHIVGPAAQAVVEAASDPNRFIVVNAAPSAAHLATLGLERFKNGRTENVAAWEPYYLTAFVAKPPRPIFGE